MSYNKIVFSALVILFTTNVHALLLVEPHLGYTLNGLGENSTVPAKTFKYNGAQYGLKLGANYLNGMAGLDFNHSSFEQMTSGWKNDFSRNEWGIFVGYTFPAVVRVWMTYFFSNSAKATSSSGLITSGSKYEGQSVELAGGYSVYPNMSLNLAFRVITLDKYITSSESTSLTGNNEVRNHELVLSLSSPFNFF